MVEQQTGNNQWERQTIQKVLLEHIEEQRRARRWRIFFKLIFVGIVIAMLYIYMNGDVPQSVATEPHTAIIDIDGPIFAGEAANASDIRDALRGAFSSRMVMGVVLRINSPGGSPVQARQIYDEITTLRKKYPNKKIYAAIEDLGASAAYLVASSVDAIYADKTSLVGSIGAKIDSFGFVEGMQKLGIERRLYTAGAHKGILDPYSPSTPEDDAFIKQLLEYTHAAFIENVRAGRGKRLKETPDIFSGLFWTGDQALQLGLIDGYGDAQYIAEEVVKAKNLVDYTPSVNVIDRIANKIGASLSYHLGMQLGFALK